MYLIATRFVVPHLLESQLVHQYPYPGGTEQGLHLQIDDRQDVRYTVYLVCLAGFRNAEVLPYLLFFQVLRFETAHMRGKRTDFLLVEPVLETTLPEMHDLAIQSRVVQRMVVGTEDILYLERQPAAVARDVVRKLR